MSPKTRRVLERLAVRFSRPSPGFDLFWFRLGGKRTGDRLARTPRVYRSSESRGYFLPGPSNGSHRVWSRRRDSNPRPPVYKAPRSEMHSRRLPDLLDRAFGDLPGSWMHTGRRTATWSAAKPRECRSLKSRDRQPRRWLSLTLLCLVRKPAQQTDQCCSTWRPGRTLIAASLASTVTSTESNEAPLAPSWSSA